LLSGQKSLGDFQISGYIFGGENFLVGKIWQFRLGSYKESTSVFLVYAPGDGEIVEKKTIFR
jgi:hypothetical protein